MVLTQIFRLLILLAALLPPVANAHDPSAWGGMFRSRDHGLSWFPVDAGLFIGGALAVSISPGDANHLLYATDTRLLRSGNGGRDWVQEPGAQFAGAIFAVRFDRKSKGAVASTSGSIFHSVDGAAWDNVLAPAGAAPVRAFEFGVQKIYLAGESGVFASGDKGRTWARASEGLPEAPVVALAVNPTPPETVFAVVQDRVWASSDGGKTWQVRSDGLPQGRIESLVLDRKLWTVAADRLFASEDNGMSWKPIGSPLPQADTSVRGIAVDAKLMQIVLATHRGVLRSVDGGKTWSQVEGNLPIHLEAGLLVRDPHDDDTLYVGFSLTPYPEIRRRAGGGANLLAQLDPVSLAGGVALLALIAVLAFMAVRWLNRARA